MRTADGAGGKKRVFQIAYNEGLLVTRAEMLRLDGYDVVSVVVDDEDRVLGNEAAKRILDKSQSYQVFIVGHDAPREEREEMFRWLRDNFPSAKILALISPYESTLTGADYSVPLNGPEQWLAAG